MSLAHESIDRLAAAVGTRRRECIAAPALAEHLDRLHREGLAAFEAQGIPTRRLERWKGTSLAALESMDFVRVGGDVSDPETILAGDADLTFVEGRLHSPGAVRADLPEGVRILSLQEAASEAPELTSSFLGKLSEAKTDGLAALHDALFEDLALVHLSPGTRTGRPLRIRSISTAASGDQPSASFPRLLVVAEAGAEASLLFESESVGEATGYTGLVTEVFLDRGARVEIVEVQSERQERIHVTQTFAKLARDARFDSHVLSLGDGLSRSELTVRLEESGASTRMRGFFLGRGRAHLDHFTTVDHEAPHTTSDEEYRGVLTDDSRGVFRGRVIIRPGAQKTDARQSNPNLLLSDRAAIDTKPQLEIYTDDVKASHGSTIGQLDADALFFLRARGIGEPEAKLLLTRAFASEIVEGIEEPTIREEVGLAVQKTLALVVAKEEGAQR